MSPSVFAHKVALVSRDVQLYETIRDILEQFSIEGPLLLAPGSKAAKASLTIRDLSSTTVPNVDEDGDNTLDLWVVSKSGLDELRKQASNRPRLAGIIIKPVRRPVLAAFISAALNNVPSISRAPCSLGASPRGDGDKLLELVLTINVLLQDCDQERTNFFTRALHDFRTPLAALQGYCEILSRQTSDPLAAGQIELLKRMDHSITRLSNMSNAMFELTSRNSSGRKPNLLRSNIGLCIQNAVGQILPMAREKGIAVQVHIEPAETYLYMDPPAIEQVLVNLLENACKFTRRNGSIEVRGFPATLRKPFREKNIDLKDTQPAYRIEVQDNGMGILPEHLSSIFEEYTSSGGGRERSGGGLGLAICKKVVGEHQGAVGAQSDEKGTTISFVLPLHPKVVIGPFATPLCAPTVAETSSDCLGG